MKSEKILLLSPAIGSSNLGDYIIMECVKKELEFITKDNFVYELPTHVSSFHWYQVLRNSFAVQNYSGSSLKFVGGSNLLVKNMLTHYPQWNINIFNYKPFSQCILVGVGAGAGDTTNAYTKFLYKKLLNNDLYHSVRDERSRAFVESLGLKAINTGCVTMWMLTPEFCKGIPKTKSDTVVFTLTGGNKPIESDQELINILQRNYNEIFYWVQGSKDFSYLKSFKNIEGIKIIPANRESYENILKKGNLDYVGTRLHAGVYALRHSIRSIIIAIDERAREINKCNNLVCLERQSVVTDLEALINSEFETKIKMPLHEIERWKSQFK